MSYLIVDDQRGYKSFIMKFQMSTWDAGDGIFKSHLTNISTEHSLNTTTKGLLHSVWWYLITRSGKWSLNKYSPVSFLCDLCHTIYHKVVFRPDIFSLDYLWNSNVKIWVWAQLEKLVDFSVSTSQWSTHLSQCLRNNWVTRERHTSVYFTTHSKLYENLFRVTQTFMEITIIFVGKWNDITSLQYEIIFHVGYVNK